MSKEKESRTEKAIWIGVAAAVAIVVGLVGLWLGFWLGPRDTDIDVLTASSVRFAPVPRILRKVGEGSWEDPYLGPVQTDELTAIYARTEFINSGEKPIKELTILYRGLNGMARIQINNEPPRIVEFQSDELNIGQLSQNSSAIVEAWYNVKQEQSQQSYINYEGNSIPVILDDERTSLVDVLWWILGVVVLVLLVVSIWKAFTSSKQLKQYNVLVAGSAEKLTTIFTELQERRADFIGLVEERDELRQRLADLQGREDTAD